MDVRHLCKDSEHTMVIRDSPAFLYSDKIRSAPCLSNTHADSFNFKVLASEGQQINITLIDLETVSAASWQNCVNYGWVVDFKTRQQTMICGGQDRKKRIVLSNSNAVEMRLDYRSRAKFLLKFAGLMQFII